MLEQKEGDIAAAPSKLTDAKVVDFSETPKLNWENFSEIDDSWTDWEKRKNDSKYLDKRSMALAKGLWNPDIDYPPPEYLAEINGVPCFPRRNIVSLTGQSGCGKSTFCALLMGSLLKGQYAGISSRLDISPRILYFDAEMDISDTARMANIVRTISMQQRPEGFYALNLLQSGFASEDAYFRRDFLTYTIRELHPDLLVIDGLAELIRGGDVNNISAAHDTKEFFSLLSTEGNMCSIVVLHENPGQEKMRGNTGTSFWHACEGEEVVTKEGDIFHVRTRKQRHFKIDYTFTLNSDLIPCFVGQENVPTPPPRAEKQNYDADSLTEAFGKNDRLRYGDLCRAYAAIASISERTSKRHIQQATEKKFLIKTEFDNEQFYEINPIF